MMHRLHGLGRELSIVVVVVVGDGVLDDILDSISGSRHGRGIMMVIGGALRDISGEVLEENILCIEGNVAGCHLAQPDVVQGLRLPDHGRKYVNHKGADPAW